ncbi:MAG: hypothetical protein HZA66_18765 [Rhodopseudomonas palustris]|uniref:Uncharacterized protein n=1 Tax=Rhodopseudomonas palustris TaxID=1076 RepID=A0A933S0C3_RHOPL|nr:hypothetical protein [Rhodopseudomonas palustris]
MSDVAQAIMTAHSEGRSPALSELGGENSVYLANDIRENGLFGVAVSALISAWSNLSDYVAAQDFISDGLRRNRDRLALGEVVSRLASSTIDLRPFVLALDARVKDANGHPISRVDAAAGMLRFALCNSRWKSSAVAALYSIDLEDDVLAVEMLCRLVSVAFEQFKDDTLLELLDELVQKNASSSQAAYELGMIEIGRALSQKTLPEICDGFTAAEAWLARSLAANAERRDSRVYLLLIGLIIPIARDERRLPPEMLEELKETALVRGMWDRQVSGQEWLLPSPQADLEWIPVVDEITKVAARLSEASWFKAETVLDSVLSLYSATRSIRPGGGELSNFLRPWIEARFVRERGLLAHLDQWLEHAGAEQLNASSATTLRSNIHRMATGGPPPGK